MTHGSLFSGIGGFDLGFEWAGIETKWQVEIDEYCQKILELRFPDAKRYRDIRKVGKELEPVDIISGGFPCQDISIAGKGAGINGPRSGLWAEMHRIIGLLRPRFAVIENVPMLIHRGLGRVLSDLAEIGYDAEWQIISARDVGAPHLRKRIWIVAYPQCRRWRGRVIAKQTVGSMSIDKQTILANTDGTRLQTERAEQQTAGIERCCRKISNSECAGLYERYISKTGQIARCGWLKCDYWEAEPNVGRVAHRVPHRVDRLRGLGNAIVPQIAYFIGKKLMNSRVKSADKQKTC